jgi:hypothetical protein
VYVLLAQFKHTFELVIGVLAVCWLLRPRRLGGTCIPLTMCLGLVALDWQRVGEKHICCKLYVAVALNEGLLSLHVAETHRLEHLNVLLELNIVLRHFNN